MTETTPTCPWCRTEAGQEPGYLVDMRDGPGRWDLQWAEGSPERSLWSGVERAEVARTVLAMRCAGCGRLELFATDRAPGR